MNAHLWSLLYSTLVGCDDSNRFVTNEYTFSFLYLSDQHSISVRPKPLSCHSLILKIVTWWRWIQARIWSPWMCKILFVSTIFNCCCKKRKVFFHRCKLRSLSSSTPPYSPSVFTPPPNHKPPLPSLFKPPQAVKEKEKYFWRVQMYFFNSQNNSCIIQTLHWSTYVSCCSPKEKNRQKDRKKNNMLVDAY